MRPLDQYIKDQLNVHLDQLEEILQADVMAILSPIVPGLEGLVRDAVEKKSEKKEGLAIVLETPGGIVEVVERMVDTVRHHYNEVNFIVPNRAMSAGTVFVMSGDQIMMDYFSRLGPIDPQIEKDGKLVPALSYLNQYERLNEKARRGDLTTAEYALLTKLDLGELHQFEQARDLSIELLKKWLTRYKFKNWKITETRKIDVTPEMKAERAEEIAGELSNPERWHSHGRGISKETLTEELNLKIRDFEEIRGLKESILPYFELMQDYMFRQDMNAFVHTRDFF
jgi:hypothetical protein